MDIDSTNSGFNIWYNSLFSTSTFITLVPFIFTLYKFWKLRKIIKPQFTYFSFVNDEHFVVKIASSFTGSIIHPKFYISKLFLGFVPSPKKFLNSIFKENLEEISRFDSKVPRTTFKDEQLFWLYPPKHVQFIKSKYKIYVETNVGNCSHIYDRRYDNMSDLF